jgi:hypothetical protein
MNTTTAQVRFDLLEKLMRRALDPAAQIGEAENSAMKLVAVARRDNISFEAFAQHFGGLACVTPPMDRIPDPPETEAPAAWDSVMPFGKYKGETLGDIALNDARYLDWLLSNATHLKWWLREGIESVLNHLAGRNAA